MALAELPLDLVSEFGMWSISCDTHDLSQSLVCVACKAGVDIALTVRLHVLTGQSYEEATLIIAWRVRREHSSVNFCKAEPVGRAKQGRAGQASPRS